MVWGALDHAGMVEYSGNVWGERGAERSEILDIIGGLLGCWLSGDWTC